MRNGKGCHQDYTPPAQFSDLDCFVFTRSMTCGGGDPLTTEKEDLLDSSVVYVSGGWEFDSR